MLGMDKSALSAPYKTATIAALQQLRDDMLKARGVAIAPPIDDSIVPGPVAEVTGLQKQHKRKPQRQPKAQGPPQPKSQRVIRAQTKRKHTELTTYIPPSSRRC